MQYSSVFKKKKIQAIENLNLSIDTGELVAVIGASGSGKSLLAHSILGLLPYNSETSGKMEFCQKELTQLKKEQKRGKEIVLVPQSVDYLDPLMKIGEQIVGENISKQRTNDMYSILNKYGLDENTANKYPFELSGGMVRRCLISTAVMEKPKLIIADEPTPGIHKDVAKRVLGHFKEFTNNGCSVLLITHDLELALTVADKIVVLYNGKCIECSTPDKLSHPYTKALLRAMPSNGFEHIKDINEVYDDTRS